MRVVRSDTHRLHDPVQEVQWGRMVNLYERAVRADNIAAALAADARFTLVDPVEHGTDPITAVHDPGLVAFLATAWHDIQRLHPQVDVMPDTMLHPALREGMGPGRDPSSPLALLGKWCWETMTPLTEGSYPAARAGVDIALTATAFVLGGDRVAYGLCRPPGHHAPRSAYGGYCFFNNAAVVAHHVASTTGTRVSVLDVDYHHGNGTQQIFYERADVQYVSLHGDPDHAYPYFTGFADETGTGRGSGTNLNLPLAPRTGDDAYLAALSLGLDAIDAFDPALVVASLGVDTYCTDPLGDLEVTTDGFERCGALVGARRRPVVVLQEGGYDIARIGENVRRWLVGIDGTVST
jgi:acetoin utilization deacetylase AcuC-like enzyme